MEVIYMEMGKDRVCSSVEQKEGLLMKEVIQLGTQLTWINSLMTNLDSLLKSRDVTLPTKVHLVKAVVFPVVMYGCESWTVKKAEHRRIDC